MEERDDEARWASYRRWLASTGTTDSYSAYEEFIARGEPDMPLLGSRPPMPGAEEPAWFRGLGSGWATLLISGVVATVCQLVAVAMAGLKLSAGAPMWSSGGVVAIVCSLLMWRRAPRWEQFKQWIWLPISLLALLSFLVVGAMNSYQIEVVDREARPATQSMQSTGRFDVVSGTARICEPGEDYLYCVNAHVSMFNSVCVGQRLTLRGDATCSQLASFVEGIKDQYRNCGYGCTTTGTQGNWGWPYLRLEAEMALATNNDAQPRVTHREQCYFDLGIVRIGSCNREAAVP